MYNYISNHYLYACLYVGMYRCRVVSATVADNLRVLYAASREANVRLFIR